MLVHPAGSAEKEKKEEKRGKNAAAGGRAAGGGGAKRRRREKKEKREELRVFWVGFWDFLLIFGGLSLVYHWFITDRAHMGATPSETGAAGRGKIAKRRGGEGTFHT